MNPSAIWQWFLATGDKLLTVATTVTLIPGVAAFLPPWLPAVLAALAAAHVIILPEPTAPGTPPVVQAPKQGGFARVGFLAWLIAACIALAALSSVSCTTLPTNATQQAGLATIVDIAVGVAVQSGQPQSAWVSRAAQFEQAAKALQAVNAAGPTTLQTLAADLQPQIAKLGPADVLAANALVSGLQPILTALLGSNPTAAAAQQDIALFLADVIKACALYTGS
jgi:hypothetical protein